MKAISLWEPWASLMMLGAKTIETRSWPTKYRGELLICAAQGGLSNRELSILLNEYMFRDALKSLSNGDLQISDLNFGRALCLVDLVDCIPTERMKALSLLHPESVEFQFGNYEDGRFAWITKNLRPLLHPFKMKGGQRIFNISQNEMETVMRWI